MESLSSVRHAVAAAPAFRMRNSGTRPAARARQPPSPPHGCEGRAQQGQTDAAEQKWRHRVDRDAIGAATALSFFRQHAQGHTNEQQ